MSTILRALKKSEQQRDHGAVPTLSRVPDPPPPPGRRLWPWWLGGALALNAAALAVLIWWLGAGPEPAEPTAMPREPQVAAGEPAPETGAPPAPQSAAAPPPASLAESEAEEAVAAPTAAPTVTPTVASTPARAPQRAAVALPALPPPVEVPVAVVVPPAAPLPEPDPYAALPLLVQLPYSFQAAIPDLPVSVHVYDEDAGNRFIIIERRKYREGDTLGNDLILEGIAPRGLVLRYQDTAFWLDL